MSLPGSGAPLRRPATARPRTGAAADVPPPAADELAAIERQLAELPRFSGAEVAWDADLGVALVSHAGRGPGMNFAACLRWTAADLDARLAQIVRHMAAADEWPALEVAEGLSQPAGLADELAARGWLALDRERIMWTRRPPVVPHLDPSTRLEAATRRSAAAYEQLERQAFGLPATHARERAAQLADAVERGEMRAFLVRVGGEPVAVARLVLGKSVAGIYGVGVAANRRRQGYGSLVTAIATRSGLAPGDRLVWLSVSEANTAALRLYTMLGYQPSFTWTRWLAPSAA